MATQVKTNQLNPIHKINAPQGFLINGKIVPSVASNNLTVALKGLDGNDPSATNPVYIRIGDTVRSITSALSVTKNAGTNWMNAGSAALATKEIDYFVYLHWNTVANAVSIGFARISHARTNADFASYNSTEEKSVMHNTGTGNSTDACEVIGRFGATLSAGTGYNWSVPTYTNANLIQRPILETRELDYSATITTSGSMTISSINSTSYKYKIFNDSIILRIYFVGTTGGTLSYELYSTIPFSALRSGLPGSGYALNSAGYGTTLNSTTSLAWRKYDGGNFTATTSGIQANITYPI